MSAKFYRLLLVMLSCVLFSCATPRSFHNPYRPLELDSDRYLDELEETGKLPGIQKGEKVSDRMEAAFSPYGKINYLQAVVYPVSFTYRIQKVGTLQYNYVVGGEVYVRSPDHSNYFYFLKKDNKLSEWRIARAWREFPDGKLEDLAVKSHEP
jgi:hypothetical protein